MDPALPFFTGIALFIGAIGLALIVAGAVGLRRERVFARHAVRAEGTVVGFRRHRSVSHRSGGNRTTLVDHPLVRYATRDGQQAQFESPFGANLRLVREGQRVPILYNPDRPSEGRLASGGARYGTPLALIVVGIVLAVGGLFASAVARALFG